MKTYEDKFLDSGIDWWDEESIPVSAETKRVLDQEKQDQNSSKAAKSTVPFHLSRRNPPVS